MLLDISRYRDGLDVFQPLKAGALTAHLEQNQTLQSVARAARIPYRTARGGWRNIASLVWRR